MKGKPLSNAWISTSAATSELGISRNHLFNLKADGTLKIGKHFRDIRRSTSMRATYKWNLPALQKLLDLGPEVR
jgi:hypothetical protein